VAEGSNPIYIDRECSNYGENEKRTWRDALAFEKRHAVLVIATAATEHRIDPKDRGYDDILFKIKDELHVRLRIEQEAKNRVP
jgi:hypothetical protein